MSNIRYVSATANGLIRDGTEEVLVSFYGPRGGSRSIESLSFDSARKLALDLLKETGGITVYSVAADTRNGTSACAFATEREAEDWILEEADTSRAEFEASGTIDVWDFIETKRGDLDTFQLNPVEISFQ